ncbi:ABC transporter substrate-binding protein [Oceanicoccus sp. KOV_DT_Chl]|uniref:ABC transporter substrate-binding protein n=1 Tax=Oceanicoccus sp. KOV_DT_Chl TaxID=1904639 RepID=UPI000C7B7086|nr:ABC transporter substrate-binding protein [Oceanicoccus sp. KOV_DT_Chl]
MRTGFSLSFLLLSLLIQPTSFANETSKPQRIISLTLCTDQVLLQLVDKNRIAAVTYLSIDPVYSDQWQQAQGVKTHDGLAETLVPLQPDLIIGSKFTSGSTVQIMEQLGYQMTLLDAPTTLAEAEQYTREIGIAVGESERAEKLIQSMRADITKAKNLVKDRPQQLAISYGPNGFTAGTHTMKNTIITTAGYRNLASELGIDYFGNISLEQLIWSSPDVVLIDEEIPNQNSLAQNFTHHPVLKQFLANRDLPRIPTSHWICPGPLAGKAILALAEQRQ